MLNWSILHAKEKNIYIANIMTIIKKHTLVLPIYICICTYFIESSEFITQKSTNKKRQKI